MHLRLRTIVTLLAVALLASAPAFAQSQSQSAPEADASWEMPRLPDGRPDLQGYWTTQTFTPMERPEYLGDQAFYSEEEFALLQSQLTVDGADPLARFVIEIDDPEERARVLDQSHRDESYVHYDNAIWLATRVPKGLSTRRTSLIVDPPNGRIPPRNEQALARAEAIRAERGDRGAFDGYELRPHSERCLNYRYNAPPLQPPSYNDIHHILQTPTHVVIFTEQSTNGPRIVPIGQPPMSDKIRQWPGDGRARWEGDTLDRREQPLQRQEPVAGLEPRPQGGGAVHPGRRRRDPLHVHGGGPRDLGPAVERRGADDGHRGADVRVRLPRGQPRHPAHPGGLPQHRAAGGGSGAPLTGRVGSFAGAKLLRAAEAPVGRFPWRGKPCAGGADGRVRFRRRVVAARRAAGRVGAIGCVPYRGVQ